MRKRRVLALFLALSMALSSNGFTALAAGEDSALTIEANSLQEADAIKGDESGNGASEGNRESGNEDAAPEGSSESGSESGAPQGNGEVGTGSGESQENGEVGSENGTLQGSSEVGSENGTIGDSTSEGNGGTGNETSEGNGEAGADGNGNTEDGDGTETGDAASEGIDGMETGDAASEGIDGAEIGSDIEKSDETDADGTDAVEGDKGNDEDAVVSESTEPVMYSFTDETGMLVTYDLNAEASYEYDVDKETKALKGVKRTDGKAITGTVELKQQEGDKYFTTIAAGVFTEEEKKEIEYIILPKGVTTIGEGAFEGYIKLRGIFLPSTLTKIEKNAFKGCTKMTQLSVPKAVTSIGNDAFRGDTSLFMVYIKDSAYSKMISIGDHAFDGCKLLEKFGSDTDFVLPGYLKTIGESAFENCHAIKKVTLPDSLMEEKDQTTGAVLPGQAALGKAAFKDCIGITDVTLSGAALISQYAFYGCANLLSVTFANGNETIDEYAFANCSRLSEVVFSYTVNRICNYAFADCSNLRYVEIPSAAATIGDTSAFPNNNNSKLWMRGFEKTAVEQYAKDHTNIQFIPYKGTTEEYFKYEYMCLTADASGTVKFTCDDKETDPNAKNGKKGVKAGDEIYAFIVTGSTVKLVDGSLRCNGTPIGKDSEGEYVFKMPVGGAYVTAEFERTGKDESQNIVGRADDVIYELSNGSALKVGQTSRMFLIDTSTSAGNSIIASSKITFETSDKSVASVSSNGTIKALKKGTAYISATVKDRDGNRTVREAEIKVEEADVYSLRLKPFSYDSDIIKVDKNADDNNDIRGIYLNKADVEDRASTFTLLATAYGKDDDEDNMSVALKWSSSDSKVAKLAKSNTKDTESQNTVTIPAGASGEATITVTATNSNPIEADNKTVTRKFIIRVMDSKPRLSSSSLILNPYQDNGVALEVISAYGADIDQSKVELNRADDNDLPSREFKLHPDEVISASGSVVRFHITSINTDIKDGTYQAYVKVQIGDNPYYLPLSIKVQRFIPNPKVKFASNQPKINLFYKDDGTEVVPVVSDLGNAKIAKYSLENLSNGTDDSKFKENFVVDEDTGIIKRSDNPMYYTSKNKPVVTGYLVLTFDGYRTGVNEKKYQITIPTKTTKPSYKLERTSDTFSTVIGEPTQTVTLALLDSKTKEVKELIDGEEGIWSVEMDSSSTSTAVSANSVGISSDGKIQMTLNTHGSGGSVVLALRNYNWDASQVLKYKYTVKLSSKKPSFKLSKSSVSLSKYFAGTQAARVSLKCNQCGVEPRNTDFVIPNEDRLSDAKLEEYRKITFTSIGDDVVEVGLSTPDIKNGSYKFVCTPLDGDGNKVTLTVKVTASVPSVSLKGSASLNLNASSVGGDGADTAELAIVVKNLPSDCVLDGDATAGSIEYVTNNEDETGLVNHFNFRIEDNKLKVSLKDIENIFAKTYTFRMTPSYTGYNAGGNTVKSVKFKVKVYRKEVSVSLKAKGKLNLLDRYDESYIPDPETPLPTSLNVAGVGNESVPDDTNPTVSGNTPDLPNPGDTNPTVSGNTPDPSNPDDTNPTVSGNTPDPTTPGGTTETPGTGEPGTPLDAYTVSFMKNGTHTTISAIKQPDEYIKVIADKEADTGTDNVAKESDSAYTFNVKPDDGYNADVEIYTTESYNTGKPDGAVPEKVAFTKTEGTAYTTYTVAVGDIKGDITVVVTEHYTISIVDNPSGIIKDLSYKVAQSEEYLPYKNDAKPVVAYGGSLSFKFTPSDADMNIVVCDEEGKKCTADTGSTETESVYVISDIKDNRTITISVVYEIIEEITKKAGTDNNTATIEYDNNVIMIDSADRAILANRDLAFKVIPNKGYNVTKAGYKLKSAAPEAALTALTSMGNDADGYPKYTIDKANITGDIVIAVETEVSDKNNYWVEFEVTGAQVKVGDKALSATPSPEGIAVTMAPENRLITFSVTPNEGYKLRYVGTDKALKAESTEITGPDEKGVYTFKLSANPDPVTTIYISATEVNNNIKVKFTGYGTSAKVSTVTYTDDTHTKITTTPLPADGNINTAYKEGDKVYFMVTPEKGYFISSIKMNGEVITPETRVVTVDTETRAKAVSIYTLDLTNMPTDVMVEISLTVPGSDRDYKYTLKNCIVYTPVLTNFKDTVTEAQIYDASGRAPSYGDEQSEYFNVEVVKGLLYVTPKEGAELKNNTAYPVKVWLGFERYDSGVDHDGNGLWVNQTLKIKTAQVLPKVTTDTNTINLYQSNTSYTATFVIRLKEGSVGEFEGIEFGEKDIKAQESFELESSLQRDGSLEVTMRLQDGSLYATNSTNKIKMYVKFKDQAVDTAGTAITMTVKINS